MGSLDRSFGTRKNDQLFYAYTESIQANIHKLHPRTPFVFHHLMNG